MLNLQINAKVISYADDTVILLSNKNINPLYETANIVIKEVKEWFDNNLLELNIKKSKYIYFNNEPILPNFDHKLCLHSRYCNGVCKNCIILEQVRTIKYLGITIDYKLKWDDYISNLTRAVQNFFYVFNEIRFIVNIDIKRMLYLSLVQSFISYGICIWGQAYDSHRYRLKITLNRLIKFLLLKPMFYSNNLAHLELNVASIDNLYVSNTLISLFRFKQNITLVDHSYIRVIKIMLIYLHVHHFKKQIDLKCCITVAIQICRLCKINIYDFFNLYNMFKLFIKKIDFSKLQLL